MSDAARLVGLWALAEAYRTDPAGQSTPNYGENPVGRLLYTADGFISAHIRAAGSGADAPSSVVAYCGNWRIEDGQVFHDVLTGSNNVASDSTVTRRLTWQDDDLVLTVEGWRPGETEGTRTLRWRRMD